MNYIKKLIFLVFILSILTSCEEQSFQLSEVINETGYEYHSLQLREEAEVLDMGKALRQNDSESISEFLELTSLGEMKEIDSGEAEEVYNELYQVSRNEEKKVLSANIAADEDLGEGFYIYMSEDGRIFATRFEESIGKQHYVNATNSTALYEAAEDYYEANFVDGEAVQVLEVLEEE
ncbi:hypothetical protein V1502_03265 [Bacillus sp. SCS-153A]|uniref:hypothetical protein n=1 Tax=Rossellomorea sedimentorum TaxID=3115294 RepID=UPI0039069C0B